MTDQYIASKLYRTETFSLGPYLIPKTITSKDGNKLNLEKIRNGYLFGGIDNPGVKKFKEFMSSNFPNIDYLLELPIPMINGFLNYRCFDIFLPKLGIAIELDSHFHDDQEEDDKRSDLYVWKKYGIKVYRVRLASEITKERDLMKLRKIIKEIKPLENNWPLDFSEVLSKEYREKHKSEFEELGKLEKQFSLGLYQGNLTLTIQQEKLLKSVLRTLEINYTIWNP